METISNDVLEKSKPVGFIDPREHAGEGAADDQKLIPGLEPKGSKEDEEARRREADRLLEEANAALAEAVSEYEESQEEEASGPVEVDVDKNTEGDRMLKAASDRVSSDFPSRINMNKSETASYNNPVVITEEDKSAFIKAITTGERYRVRTALFGGRIPLVLRSRSVGESEAIDSYVRRRITDGFISNGTEYGDALRLCLLVASVERLGDETFEEMQGPLLTVVKGKDDIREPGWIQMLDFWRDKPEGLVNAVLKELFAFEAKYTEMVSRSADENFWNPEESTGE